eukprot:Awhi_evm8s12155
MEDTQASSSTDPIEGGPKFDGKYFKQRKPGSGVKKGTVRGPYNTIAKKNKLLIDDGVDVVNKQQQDINKGLNMVNKQRQDLDLIEGQNDEPNFSNAKESGNLAASFHHQDDRVSNEVDNELLILKTEMEMIKLWMTGNMPRKRDVVEEFDYDNYFDIKDIEEKERLAKQLGDRKSVVKWKKLRKKIEGGD